LAGFCHHRCATGTRRRLNNNRRRWLRLGSRKAVTVVGSVAGIAIRTRMTGANPCCLVAVAEATAATEVTVAAVEMEIVTTITTIVMVVTKTY